MDLTASEEATLHFYEWEYLGRGYYHFDAPVNIEPPYRPFTHFNTSFSETIDDGKVPSLLERLSNAFETKPVVIKKGQPKPIVPMVLETMPEYVGFSISFELGYDISQGFSEEFIGMLAFANEPISFEILSKDNVITVQIICSLSDESRVRSHIKAYFPSVLIRDIDIHDLGFQTTGLVAIADFGLNDEFMRPVENVSSFSIDPLASIIATMDAMFEDELALFQVIFKGVTAPWANEIVLSVSDGIGGSFFSDSPEMIACARSKVSSPLFSVVMRVVAQGDSDERSKYLATQLAQSITGTSTSGYNKLIPLSNEGYDYVSHIKNVFHRTSNRLGMILNSQELVSFVHYPHKTVFSKKLGLQGGKTKSLPNEAIGQKYILGTNIHNGIEQEVTLNDEFRLRHTHIIGVTGVGKSTLIANMIFEDIDKGNGCALFDPHGDICDDILARIPENKKDDVIIIDPSDSEYPIGFNLLGARTDAEKIVLSSDLVSAFKRHATAWGDNMTAVLSNAINAFLESERSGTLIELKRFLLEEKFRKEFLASVDDQSIHYYWEYEYPMVKKGIAPLLTRIDTFLRPKVIRYMLAQKNGIDFRACIEEKKIVLIKLSQGLIGEDNSYLLGSLFLSKFNQVAQGRQSLEKSQRHPYYIYCDEFQNFITPSITRILSGARKYGLGLILAHQELAQIDDAKTLNSVISNPHTRICFRLGDGDAKKLESGFSYFEQNDLQSLGIGQAIIRIGSSNSDCNVSTFPLPEIDNNNSVHIKSHIIQKTRDTYAKSKQEVENILYSLLPQIGKIKEVETTIQVKKETLPVIEDVKEESKQNKISEKVTSELIQKENESREIRDHTYLQSMIKKLGQDRNYIATTEYLTKDGGRIDIVLEKDSLKIGFEISATNKPEYEVKNIRKCLKDGCALVVIVSKQQSHLNNIKELATKELSKKDVLLVQFMQPSDITPLLDELVVYPQLKEEVVKGFRVVTEYDSSKNNQLSSTKSQLIKLLKKKK